MINYFLNGAQVVAYSFPKQPGRWSKVLDIGATLMSKVKFSYQIEMPMGIPTNIWLRQKKVCLSFLGSKTLSALQFFIFF